MSTVQTELEIAKLRSELNIQKSKENMIQIFNKRVRRNQKQVKKLRKNILKQTELGIKKLTWWSEKEYNYYLIQPQCVKCNISDRIAFLLDLCKDDGPYVQRLSYILGYPIHLSVCTRRDYSFFGTNSQTCVTMWWE